MNPLRTAAFALQMLFGVRGRVPAVGSMAPDFNAIDHTGAEFRLSAHRGRRVILWFYPKAATPG